MRVADNAVIDEVAGYTWFQLYEARLFACRVRWSDSGRREDVRDVYAADLHDQGGRARFRSPDGRELEIERRELRHNAEHETAELAAIDAALARLAQGLYGQCEACGVDIPEARLTAYPMALRCVGCQSTAEKAH